MNKPVTAQELIDWIRDYLEQLDDNCIDEEPKVILSACKAYLEEMENGT